MMCGCDKCVTKDWEEYERIHKLRGRGLVFEGTQTEEREPDTTEGGTSLSTSQMQGQVKEKKKAEEI